eukprot:CAMPEP_0171189880 /NCGR_PEP_ID=MMETSP0790-20130122/18572_1 /TAXON_ID=2925 /ORGANISM="Alexandrium catenella, Strain OF101" /LENGTH=247 /DNA_ID=CAMNT_0011655001 /DNA_START=34 /DNA_END=775 /DNA_ORIENTATION=+
MAPRLASAPLALLLAATAAVQAAGEEPFRIRFELERLSGEKGNAGSFVVEVHPDWAPLGAQRVREIVEERVWETARFFRVVEGFVAQWGIPGKPSVAATWKEKKIKDDPVKPEVQNLEGYVTFAKSGPDTRTTQAFINLSDNTNLDSMGFPPWGRVVEGLDVVKKINTKNGESPNQGEIQSSGNVYLKKSFPDLTFIKKVSFVDPVAAKGELEPAPAAGGSRAGRALSASRPHGAAMVAARPPALWL